MENARKREIRDAAGEGEARAAITWLQAEFPEVACSRAPDEGVRLPSAFWAEASPDVETCLAYQERFGVGMDDKVRAAHLIAFYSHQLSLVSAAIYLCSSRVPDVTGLRFERYARPLEAGAVDAGRFLFAWDLRKAPAATPRMPKGFSTISLSLI